jgi:hypoxanthine phosphoribosyltransferase
MSPSPEHLPRIDRILISEADLREKLDDLGARITGDYPAGTRLLLVGVLKGSFYFLADLSRRIDLPVEIDFVTLSSYTATESRGGVDFRMDLTADIRDRDVLVVEDIVDTGRTLNALLHELHSRGPASLRVCTLLDKPERREIPIHVHYTGFTIPDAFVVGYGLDLDEQYRNLPYVGILKT